MTQVVRSLDQWRHIAGSNGYRQKVAGFVPTMGALHQGHRSLIDRCRSENDLTVVSIFVNPTQFNDPKDLRNYPRTFEKDLELLEAAGVDYLLSPDYESIYPDDYRYQVQETSFSAELCGKSRPGHFTGVLSVVMKLLQLVRPHRAYFGEKDYQQFVLIKEMARAFFLQTEIRSCPTIRDDDGVAMSSRNALLSPDGRSRAAEFARLLKAPMNSKERMDALANVGTVEYIEEMLGRRFGAIRIDGVRLIDNIPLEEPN